MFYGHVKHDVELLTSAWTMTFQQNNGLTIHVDTSHPEPYDQGIHFWQPYT